MELPTFRAQAPNVLLRLVLPVTVASRMLVEWPWSRALGSVHRLRLLKEGSGFNETHIGHLLGDHHGTVHTAPVRQGVKLPAVPTP